MKKLILIVTMAVITQASFAQVSFGIQAGANFGMGKLKYDEAFFDGTSTHSQKNKMKIGLLGGVVVEVPFSSSLAFRPEINFFQEGTKHSFVFTSIFGAGQVDQKVTLNYVQIPLNVVYKMAAGPGSAFFGLGPVVQIGLSGKDKLSSPTNPTDPDFNRTADVKFDGKKSDDITDPNDNNVHLKRLDVGLDVLAGYQLALGVFLKLGYSHGFMEISPDKKNTDPTDRVSYKNSGFSVSVGYMFGGGGKKK